MNIKNWEKAKKYVEDSLIDLNTNKENSFYTGRDKGEITNDAANIYSENYNDYCELLAALENYFGF